MATLVGIRDFRANESFPLIIFSRTENTSCFWKPEIWKCPDSFLFRLAFFFLCGADVVAFSRHLASGTYVEARSSHLHRTPRSMAVLIYYVDYSIVSGVLCWYLGISLLFVEWIRHDIPGAPVAYLMGNGGESSSHLVCIELSRYKGVRLC